MGQPIIVTEKPSSNRGVVRFETNRALTGMGHERYLPGTEIWGHRPPDELARRLLAHESVAGVQINGNIVTVDLTRGHTAEGLKDIIENLYRFYPDTPAAPASEAAPEGAPEAVADPAPAAEPVAQSEAAVVPDATSDAPVDVPAPDPVLAPEAPPEDEPTAG